MNEKFYALPIEKQNRIINAGFKVFAENSYKKSPVNEIALEAGISKSLLFFYFKNKKELYLFLLKQSEEITMRTLMESGVYSENDDIFDMMYKGLLVKAKMMKDYPDMGKFSIKAYYEKDPEVASEVREIIAPYTEMNTNQSLPPMDLSKFKDGIDIRLMYQDMYLASEGYLWRMQQTDDLDIDKMVEDYKEIIEFWKTIYLK